MPVRENDREKKVLFPFLGARGGVADAVPRSGNTHKYLQRVKEFLHEL